jgi:hypothetical protein
MTPGMVRLVQVDLFIVFLLRRKLDVEVLEVDDWGLVGDRKPRLFN